METVHFIPPSQRKIALLASSADQAPVLITGSSGTGKGAIAKWIHQNSPRSLKSFITASPSMPLAQQILASEQGTLFIPEIGEWPMGEQKMLAQFLATHTLSGVAAPTKLTRLVNVRIIASSSHNLDKRAQGGLFNQELLERLNVFKIDMPSLSKREEDFEDIVIQLLKEMTHELKKDHVQKISDAVWQKFKNYSWPGNLRELRNVIRLAVYKTQTNTIEESDLPDFENQIINFKANRKDFEKVVLLELMKDFDWKKSKSYEITRNDNTNSTNGKNHNADSEKLNDKIKSFNEKISKLYDEGPQAS